MSLLVEFAAELFTPPPDETPWEWCERNVNLPPQVTNRPGPWRSEVTPYVRAPMEAIADPRVKFLILCWSAQSSKTQMVMNIWLWLAANNPMNTVLMMPSKELATSFSKARLSPIISACPPVNDKLSENRHDDSLLEKLFVDMTLNLVGGNSAANLSSRPAGIFIGDEIDKLPKELNREACPVALGIERTKTYQGRRKIILASTVTTRDHKIFPYLESGTFKKLYWKCPHCAEDFTPVWAMVKWPKDEGKSDAENAKGAWIECPHCHGEFKERHKRKALAEARWISTNPEAEGDIDSYHLSEIQSPFTPLPDLVLKFIRASRKAKRGDTGDLQNFVNSSLCEPWEEGAYGRRKAEDFHHMKGQFPRGVVPNDALAIVFGADTQDNGWWYVLRAFGMNGTSWMIQEGFVTSLEALESALFSTKNKVDGRPIETSFGIVDAAGHRTDEVVRWAAKHPGRVMPGFGRQRMQKVVAFSDIDAKEASFGTQQRILIDTNHFKNKLAAQMKVGPGDDGRMEVHAEISDEYFAQMTAEYLDDRMLWVCPKHHPNHMWDCEVYAAAAAHVVGCALITEENKGAWINEQGIADTDRAGTHARRRKEQKERDLDLF